MTQGEVLARVAMQRALKGDDRGLSDALKCFWPATEKLEHSGPDGGALEFERPVKLFDHLSEADRKLALELRDRALLGDRDE